MADDERTGPQLPRDFLDGRYTLLEQIGEGGMAKVYLAEDRVLGGHRAVKIIRGTGRAQERRQLRLQKEARALSEVEHPNVLRSYEFGVSDEGAYLVMRYAEGGTLAERVAEEGPLAPVRAVDWIVQVLEGLHAAHRAGVVHRDVKPSNVLLDLDGRAMIADFGIARLESDHTITRAHSTMGSMAYMAPEQRLDAHRVGPAADVYAAACTLFNVLTASTPLDLFAADPASRRWFGVPDPLRPVLQRATNHDPEARYPSARAFGDALQEVRQQLAEGYVTTPFMVLPQDDGSDLSTLDGSETTSDHVKGWVWWQVGGGLAMVLWMLVVLLPRFLAGPLETPAQVDAMVAPADVAEPEPTMSWPQSEVEASPDPTPAPAQVAQPSVRAPAQSRELVPGAREAVAALARPAPPTVPVVAAEVSGGAGGDAPSAWRAACARQPARPDEITGCWKTRGWFNRPAWMLLVPEGGAWRSTIWNVEAGGEPFPTHGSVKTTDEGFELVDGDPNVDGVRASVELSRGVLKVELDQAQLGMRWGTVLFTRP